MEQLEDRVLFDASPDAIFLLPGNAADVPHIPVADVQSNQQNQYQTPTQLILIDEDVTDNQSLIADITSDSDAAFEIRLISGDENGVAQIAEILSQDDAQYEAVHVLSHGSDGELDLGNSTLTLDNLKIYSSEIASWADGLTSDESQTKESQTKVSGAKLVI